jgi:galactose oxidase
MASWLFLVLFLFAPFAAAPPSSTVGQWAGPYPLPLISVAVSNLANGKVLMWAAAGADENIPDFRGKTFVSVFDPVTTNTTLLKLEDTEHNMFCPGTAVLADGRVFITGGRDETATSFYDPYTDNWSKGPKLNVRVYVCVFVFMHGCVCVGVCVRVYVYVCMRVCVGV